MKMRAIVMVLGLASGLFLLTLTAIADQQLAFTTNITPRSFEGVRCVLHEIKGINGQPLQECDPLGSAEANAALAEAAARGVAPVIAENHGCFRPGHGFGGPTPVNHVMNLMWGCVVRNEGGRTIISVGATPAAARLNCKMVWEYFGRGVRLVRQCNFMCPISIYLLLGNPSRGQLGEVEYTDPRAAEQQPGAVARCRALFDQK